MSKKKKSFGGWGNKTRAGIEIMRSIMAKDPEPRRGQKPVAKKRVVYHKDAIKKVLRSTRFTMGEKVAIMTVGPSSMLVPLRKEGYANNTSSEKHKDGAGCNSKANRDSHWYRVPKS